MRGVILGLVCVVGAAFPASARAQQLSPAACGSLLLSVEPQVLADNSQLIFSVPADMDGDGIIDEVSSDGISVTVTYRGTAAKPQQVFTVTSGTRRALAVGDLDGAPGAELLVMGPAKTDVLAADVTGALHSIASVTLESTGSSPFVASVGHFRSQTTADLLLGNTSTKLLSLYSLSGITLAAVPGVELLSAGATTLDNAIAIADMDGDGLDDLVFGVNGGVSMARLGSRSTWELFQNLELPGQRLNCSAIAVGDFNGDGRRDLAVEAEVNDGGLPVNTWLQTATGDFSLLPEGPPPFWGSPGRLLVGDLNKDGKDDLVNSRAVAQLMGDTWAPSPPLPYERALNLFDWDGDGSLELTALDQMSHLVRAGLAHADLELTLGSDSQLDVSAQLRGSLVIKNLGPTATEGIALTSNLPGGHFPFCTDSSGNGTDKCPLLVLSPQESFTIGFSQDATANRDLDGFDVSVCSGAPDPDPANNTLHVPITHSKFSDLGIGMSSFFLTTGEFGVSTFVVNDGPATAYDLHLTIQIEPGGIIPEVASDPPSARCTSDAHGATCDLDSLAWGETWQVSSGGLQYSGSEITITSTVTASSPDPDLSRNTYVMRIPAGLKPVGAPSGWPGTSSSADSGCSCSLRGRAAQGAPWSLVLIAAWLLRRARSRRAARVHSSATSRSSVESQR
ncbi:MAG: FG-GAP-like repeat-containing protein [Pseudomonadota bacterium]